MMLKNNVSDISPVIRKVNGRQYHRIRPRDTHAPENTPFCVDTSGAYSIN